ncbi:MAG: GNAT family N-acetyltransferase [Devosia sp.]
MTHTLRTAGPDDAAAVDALTQAAYAKWVPIVGRRPRPMTVDYTRAVVEHRIDLVEAGNRLLALVELADAPDHLLIVNLAVAPEAQGQGLGSMLLRHGEEVARELGRPTLRLYTNRMMAPNIAFYEARGYVIDREEAFPEGGFTVHMSKPVPAAAPLADPAARR